MIKETEFKPNLGWFSFFLFWLVLLGGPLLIEGPASTPGLEPLIAAVIPAMLADIVCFAGFMIVQPNQGRVMMFFGKYRGTVKTAGFYWVPPFYSKHDIVQLDDERRAAMVSNLLVVLCSGGHTRPVVNTGTLYH